MEHVLEKNNVSKIRGNEIQLTFKKRTNEYIFWIWLTKDGSKNTKHFIVIDLNKWKEENDDDGDHKDAFSKFDCGK